MPQSTASCSESPDPVAVGATYTITGSGIFPKGYLNVVVSDRVGTQAYAAGADANGDVTVSGTPSWDGPYHCEFWDINPKSGHHTVLCSCDFTAV